jgi:hypothetical protein
LADAEAATKIRGRYLEALEREQFDLLPAGPYGRSFLREYAEFLGLDGDILAAEYDLRFAPEEPLPQPPTARQEMAWLLEDVPFRPILAVVGVVAVAGLGAWILGHSGSGSVPPAPTPLAAAAAATPPAHSAPVQVRKPATTVVHRRPSFSLTAARGTCWLSVHLGSSSGSTVYEGTLQQGQTVRFGLREPLWVRVGAPWNVDVAIGSRGVNGSLPPQTGNVLVTTGGLRQAA